MTSKKSITNSNCSQCGFACQVSLYYAARDWAKIAALLLPLCTLSTTLFPFVGAPEPPSFLGTKPLKSKFPRFPILWHYGSRPKIMESMVSALPETSQPTQDRGGLSETCLEDGAGGLVGTSGVKSSESEDLWYAPPCQSCPSSEPLPAWWGYRFVSR